MTDPVRLSVYHARGVRPQLYGAPPVALVTDRWSAFIADASRAWCIEVLVIRDLRSWPWWDDFVRHAAETPANPRILATVPDPESLRRTVSVRLADLIWLQDNDRLDLSDSVRRAWSHGLLNRCANALATVPGISSAPELRAALVAACAPGSGVRSVNGLARLAGRDRRTLSTAWTRCVGPSPAIRLKGLLDLILLTRAIRHREQGRTWSEVSRALDVSVDVLRRTAKSRLGIGLSELSTRTGQSALEQLEAMVNGEPARWPLLDDVERSG